GDSRLGLNPPGSRGGTYLTFRRHRNFPHRHRPRRRAARATHPSWLIEARATSFCPREVKAAHSRAPLHGLRWCFVRDDARSGSRPGALAKPRLARTILRVQPVWSGLLAGNTLETDRRCSRECGARGTTGRRAVIQSLIISADRPENLKLCAGIADKFIKD